MNNVITKINRLKCGCFNIYPTGSLELTSDKDIQITFNIMKCESVKLLNNLISRIFNVIKTANKDWNTEDFEYLLDIHFYPPTLLNFMGLNEKSILHKYIHISKTEKLKNIIFIPMVQTPKLLKDFQKKEYNKLKTKIKEKTKVYYQKYTNEISVCLYTLIECCKGNIKLLDQEYNDYLHCLTKYNHIGPEMYRTISSIIIVVWHLHMNNALSTKLIKALAPVAFRENKFLYKKSKKQKYKDRYQYCKKYM